MKNISVVYIIEEASSWRSKESINIKSNIAEDELIECKLATSLIEELKEKATILNADKLLLGFAEAQKRGIQENLESLNDFELEAKNHADSIHEKLLKSEENFETKYYELQEKFSAITKKFETEIIQTTEKLITQVELIKSFEESLNKINTYSMDRITETIQTVLTLVEKEPELVKTIFKSKLG